MPISRQYESGLKRPGSHLRSMREVLGYQIHTTDGEAGTLRTSSSRNAVGRAPRIVGLNQPAHRSILLRPIDSIHLVAGQSGLGEPVAPGTGEKPDFDPTNPVNRDNEHRLYDYYGRPIYSPGGFETERRPEIQQH